MATPFDRTLRVLDADLRQHKIVGLVLALFLLAVWLAWFLLGRLGLYVVSSRARLEATREVHDVAPAVDGRLVKVSAELGDHVEAGEVIAVIDPKYEELKVDEASARIDAARRDLTDLDSRNAATSRLFDSQEQTIRTEIEQARALADEARNYGTLATERVARMQRLHRDQLVSESDLREAELDAAAKRDRYEALRIQIRKLESDLAQTGAQRATTFADLQRETNKTTAELQTATIARHQLRQQVDVRQVRAPIAGSIASLANFQVGSFVSGGDRIAQIVPNDTLRIVAHFPPSALGRLAPEQQARMRIDHPILGSRVIAGRVVRVGGEPTDDGVEAIIAVSDALRSDQYRHGISGTVEVLVSRSSPAGLVVYKLREAMIR